MIAFGPASILGAWLATWHTKDTPWTQWAIGLHGLAMVPVLGLSLIALLWLFWGWCWEGLPTFGSPLLWLDWWPRSPLGAWQASGCGNGGGSA